MSEIPELRGRLFAAESIHGHVLASSAAHAVHLQAELAMRAAADRPRATPSRSAEAPKAPFVARLAA